MRYGILGTTQAHTDDGRPVAVGGARLRALLAAFALNPGRGHASGMLIDLVWGDEPPADAPGALQALVARLRRALGAGAVESVAGGYRLNARPDDVDLHRFQRLADEGERTLADGDPVKAAGLLDDALALWRGSALSDLPGHEALAARLDARHLAARRGRLAASVALGDPDAALPELAELCADHPLDEPLHALRLRALRAAGRPAEALAAYEDVRAALADRLGTDPGPELRALHAELLGGGGGGESWAAGASGGAAPGRSGRPAPGRTAGPAGSADGTGTAAGWPGRPGGPGPEAAARDAGGTAGRHGQAGWTGQDGRDGRVGQDAQDGRDGRAREGGTDGQSPWAGAAGVAGTAGAAGTARAIETAGAAGTDGESASAGAGHPAGRTGPAGRDGHPGPGAPGAYAPPRPDTDDGQGRPSGAAERSAPAPAGRAPRGNLRARLTSFVGREDDVRVIRRDLERHRLVTLLGPGGAGKTRLSQEAAEAVARETGAWPDGVWLAELAPVDDPATVPEAVLTALGGRETVVRGTAEGLRAASDATSADPLVRLAELCGPRRMLLVLDNCEHVIDAAARLAETLLAHCPGVTVLATSREPLAVPGESVRPVEPLPDPVALRLLADRGAAARPGFRIEDDPAACAEICRRLDGLPLAVELAAARLRMLTPRGLADRLDDRFRLLTSGSRTVLPRQQTLRAVVDWSWDLLDAPERAVLRRLSVFAGGCDLAAAEAVCSGGTGGTPGSPDGGSDGLRDGSGPHGGPRAEGAPAATDVPEEDVAVIVGSLVDKSLVVAAPADDGEMRYRLLETVGEYAAERLDEAGERAAVERRHLVHYRELARTTEPLLRGPDQRVLLDRLEREHDNLRTALRRAVAARDEQEALCLVLSLGWFWQLRDHRVDGSTWSEAAMGLGPDPFDEPVRPAPPLYERCVDAPPPMSPELLMEARREVRLVWLSNREHDIRVTDTPDTQAWMRRVADAYGPGQPQNCRVPGFAWYFVRLFTGDVEGIHRSLDNGVEMCRELGYEWELAFHLQQRAKLLNEIPDRADRSLRDADESLGLFRRIGDAWGVAEALAGRAESHERRGAFAEAARDYREALDNARVLGSRAQLPMLKCRLAEVLAESGEIGKAEGERLLREALEEAEPLNPDAAYFIRISLGIRIARNGGHAEAREILQALHEELRDRSVPLFATMLESVLGWVDVLQGRPADALPKLRSALTSIGDPLTALVAAHLPVHMLLNAAFAHSALPGREHAATAARLLGAVTALRPGGLHEASVEREVRERTMEAARAALGEEAYERAHAEGGRLSLGEAAALV
ncbi:AfsR/SARP family transcriptional regulator [Streptomyces sp. NPDC021100]|uniref:AfsR/SARP family transcriptional regulator n=1 Tax=Streptomyces sp. NPDC021100 TaxID=3365114 RepID=UPI0037B64ED4